MYYSLLLSASHYIIIIVVIPRDKQIIYYFEVPKQCPHVLLVNVAWKQDVEKWKEHGGGKWTVGIV